MSKTKINTGEHIVHIDTVITATNLRSAISSK